MVGFNLLTICLCLISAYASNINPDHSWVFAFIGVVFPLTLLANLAWIGFWLFAKPLFALGSVAAIVFTWGSVTQNIVFNSKQAEPNDSDLKIITYNIKNFDLYNWSKNHESRDTMLAILKRADPDILCLQEFYTEDYGVSQNIKLLKDAGWKYFHFEPTLRLRNRDNWGIAIFSRFPIIHHDAIKFDNSKFNLAIYADIEIDKKVLRVYNLHLQSIHFGRSDYEYFKEPEAPSQRSLPSIMRIASKLRSAFKKRGHQADSVREVVDNNQVPTIICGDFNDTPNSYVYKSLSEGMKDAFLEAGNGIGSTYTGPIPFVRTDYVLLNNDLEVRSQKVIKREISDHFPVEVIFGF